MGYIDCSRLSTLVCSLEGVCAVTKEEEEAGKREEMPMGVC